MKEVLNKLFAQDTPASVPATIIRWLSPGRYELEDDAGRKLQADTTAILSPGTRVMVQADRIVAVIGRNQSIRTYEV
ncbi:MAG: hypothetical protein ACOYB1_18435 [Limnohabitans sp.]